MTPATEAEVEAAVLAALTELPAAKWLNWQRRTDIARAATQAAWQVLMGEES